MTLPKPAFPSPVEPAETHFGPFRLCSDGTLFRQAAEIRLPPKELQLLRLLLAHPGQVVPAAQLRHCLWGNVFVSPDSLPRCISSLRAHLGSQESIQTIYKRGYRFTIPVALPSAPRRLSQIRLDPARPAPTELPRQSSATLPRLAILPLIPGPGVPPSLGTQIAEATILRLSRMRTPSAALLAQDSVFSLAAGGATAHQTGIALHAHLALAGSVLALPTHLRIRTEMIRVSDAVQLWMEDFLVPRNAMPAPEVEAARRIAANIRSRATPPLLDTEPAESQQENRHAPLRLRA